MSFLSIILSIIISFIGMVSSIILQDSAQLDFLIQNKIYSFFGGAINENDTYGRFFFYRMPKVALTIFGIYIFLKLVYTIINLKKAKLKNNSTHSFVQKIRVYIFILTVIIVTPLCTAIGKALSQVHCPSEVINFGGKYNHLGLLEHWIKNPSLTNPDARCFPGAHATTGFAIIALAYVVSTKKKQLAALGLTLTIGWTVSFYQIAKGAHFFSHNLFTMFLAIFISSSLYLLFFKSEDRKR